MEPKLQPYRSIWLNPKSTFENCILNNKDQSLLYFPLVIFGICIGLDRAPGFPKAIDNASFWPSLPIAIPMCIGISFLVVGLIMPFLIKLFGRIWNGAATMRQMANVASLCTLPFCLLLIHQLVLLALGQDPTFENLNQGMTYILQLWSFSLFVIGVAKIQKFTYGMALLNISLSYLPAFVLGLLRL